VDADLVLEGGGVKGIGLVGAYCGLKEQDGGIVRIELVAIPEGPPGPAFERTPGTYSKPLTSIQQYIPDPLPAPLEQWPCSGGDDLVVTFEDGKEVTYGPCHRPPSIDHLCAEMIYVMENGRCAPRCGPGGTPGP
jgi:hypothetical protein